MSRKIKGWFTKIAEAQGEERQGWRGTAIFRSYRQIEAGYELVE